MTASWATIIYWVATILAGLIAGVVVMGYFFNASEGEPVIPIAPLLLAGGIWLIGSVCRRLLAGR